tara:strand:+ start:899 stop:1384 length:486 start_codon:yes stop_codon:yes gene_type:complete
MFSDPQFWIFIAFLIFLLAIFKPVKTILTKGLDSKILEIKQSIDQAEKIKNQAQITLSEIKKRENELKEEIKKIQSNAKEKILSIEKNINEKLQVQIEKHQELAKNRIDQMQREANLEIKNYIIKNAINATYAILEKKLNESEKQKLIDYSINDLNSILKH